MELKNGKSIVFILIGFFSEHSYLDQLFDGQIDLHDGLLQIINLIVGSHFEVYQVNLSAVDTTKSPEWITRKQLIHVFAPVYFGGNVGTNRRRSLF